MGSIIVPAEGTMKLTKTEVMELQRQANARNGRADSARHARLILLLSEGLTWAQIRAKLDCSDSYIDRWSKRFAADRLAGLFARHAGRQRYKVTDRIEARVLAWTTKRKPADGSTHWSSRKLAAELGGAISHMTVARIWAKHELKPHRLEGYLASNDPETSERYLLSFRTQALKAMRQYQAEVPDRCIAIANCRVGKLTGQYHLCGSKLDGKERFSLARDSFLRVGEVQANRIGRACRDRHFL